MKPRSIVLLLLLGLGLPAVACINAFGTDKDGRRFDALGYTGADLESMLTYKRERSYWVTNAKGYEKAAIEEPSYENATNLGVSLIYRGQYIPAIRLFTRLEKSFPGRPETAANLGTALELSGRDEIALKWIRIGIHRNRQEHEGTEWLHARILEAKIADAAGRWDRSRSIAGLVCGTQIVPAVPTHLPAGNDGRPVKPHELDSAFRYQLNERMKFVAPKDWVVANLLQDWATLNLAGGPLENARVLYRLALRYGLPATPLSSRRMERIDQVLAKSKDSHSSGYECAICPPVSPPPPR